MKPGVCYTINLDISQANKIEIKDMELSEPVHFRALAYYNFTEGMSDSPYRGYKVTQDIDFSGETYFPITFVGGFIQGNGHTLSDIHIDWPYEGAGLFDYTPGTSIENLNLENITVNGTDFVGAFCGKSKNATLINCTLKGTNIITGTGDYIGGIGGGTTDEDLRVGTGAADTRISLITCQVNEGTTVSGKNFVGGMAGSYNAANNCTSAATVKGTDYVGGIAGGYGLKDNGDIDITSQCRFTGSVTGQSYVGGIIGAGVGRLDQCYTMGTVTGGNYVGGIAGSGLVTNCYSLADVTGTENTAGIVGNFNTNYYGTQYVRNCYYAGNVSSGYGIACSDERYQDAYSRIENCLTTASHLGSADGEADKVYTGLTSIMEHVNVINSESRYSTTKTWEGYAHECPIFLWQITPSDDEGEVVVPPFEEEEW